MKIGKKHKRKHRFSFLITPISFLGDAFILSFAFYFFFRLNFLHIFILVGFWFVLSVFTGFYKIKRNTTYNELLNYFFKHVFVYFVSVIAYLKVFDAEYITDKVLLYYILILMAILLIVKTLYYMLLKQYRSKGYNCRRVVIFGYNDELKQFRKLVDQRIDYGLRFLGYFTDKKVNAPDILGTFKDGLKYISDEENEVDMIFASVKELGDKEIDELLKTSEEAFLHVNFIPDNRDIFKKKLEIQYFEYFPVLSIRKSPLDDPLNAFIKRSFDVIFSLFIIVFVLSWLTPLLALLIKMESKGPVFFKQLRNGLNYEPFYCYKFRSMKPNRLADLKQVSKGDNRVTGLGKILRKTSIDELPQFINVLKGEMSVVGPRPHMIAENERFRKRVDKFLGRHYVRPGITGLAQVKGFRGEVRKDEDILNRVKYDLYYIENWSIFLDIKIILQTILNIFKGDKKAY